MSSIEELRSATTTQPVSSTQKSAGEQLSQLQGEIGPTAATVSKYISDLSDRALQELDQVMQEEKARHDRHIAPEQTRVESALQAMKETGDRLGDAERALQSAPFNQRKKHEALKRKAQKKYDEAYIESKDAIRARSEKSDLHPVYSRLELHMRREKNRRARRAQKSASHLITYRAQLLQTIERIA
jgi:Skp family chaperone for outer membrane proteins